MFLIEKTPVEQTGTPIYRTTSAGTTARFRGGLPVTVERAGDTDSPLCSYRVFVAGRFLLGWRTTEQAIAYAQRW